MTGMRLHPRHPIVAAAQGEIADAVLQAIKTHDLTYPELLTILTEVQRAWVSYMLRDERNPSQPEEDTPVSNGG